MHCDAVSRYGWRVVVEFERERWQHCRWESVGRRDAEREKWKRGGRKNEHRIGSQEKGEKEEKGNGAGKERMWMNGHYYTE